jgi:hypothetical protein
MTSITELLADRAAHVPELNLIWTAVVDIGPREALGETSDGQRYIVPILGGEFIGGPGLEDFSGKVLKGGADRQLIDRHGFKQLDAQYEMQTNDGAVFTIHNRVKIDESVQPSPYKVSVIHATAPRGQFEWMNRRVFLGTLDPARPVRDAVIIRGWGKP